MTLQNFEFSIDDDDDDDEERVVRQQFTRTQEDRIAQK